MTQDFKDKPKPLDLQSGIIYGPVNSRRLGSSLGLNLLPTVYKFCSFNCVYCQYGLTRPSALIKEPQSCDDMPSPEDMERALSSALKEYSGVSYITFSGNGESTMHPQFPEMVDVVISCRDRLSRESETAILSNSTGLLFPEARESIFKLDAPFMKLDAGSRDLFQRINRPDRSIEFEKIVEELINFSHPNLKLQAIFFDGDPCNTTEKNVDEWAALLSKIKPLEVHIYTTERPVADSRVLPISIEKLNWIASRAEEISGVCVIPFHR